MSSAPHTLNEHIRHKIAMYRALRSIGDYGKGRCSTIYVLSAPRRRYETHCIWSRRQRQKRIRMHRWLACPVRRYPGPWLRFAGSVVRHARDRFSQTVGVGVTIRLAFTIIIKPILTHSTHSWFSSFWGDDVRREGAIHSTPNHDS